MKTKRSRTAPNADKRRRNDGEKNASAKKNIWMRKIWN
jgi:hypothetical protein